MNVLRFSPRFLGLCAVLALQGCVLQPPAQFYQLDQGSPELPAQDKGMTVLLGPVQLADYLQRENLMQRGADDSLTISAQARWAGNLQEDVGQLLLRQLAGQLDTSRIALYPDRAGFQAQVQVLLTISRLDSGVQQPAVLEAQWRLLDETGVMRGSQLIRLQEEHVGTPAAQVRAQSVLLRRLAEQLSSAITSMPKAEPVAAQKPKPAPAKRPPSPSIPMIEPAKQVEVFRF
ncbi:PqiC family protein [Pseudomonas borbori]